MFRKTKKFPQTYFPHHIYLVVDHIKPCELNIFFTAREDAAAKASALCSGVSARLVEDGTELFSTHKARRVGGGCKRSQSGVNPSPGILCMRMSMTRRRHGVERESDATDCGGVEDKAHSFRLLRWKKPQHGIRAVRAVLTRLALLLLAATAAAGFKLPASVIASAGGSGSVCAGRMGSFGESVAGSRQTNVVAGVVVAGASVEEVNGVYHSREPGIVPAGFTETCVKMGWPAEAMWVKLSDGRRAWFESENGSYIYWNRSDGCWWIDAPSGAGVYIQKSSSQLPPVDGQWEPLNEPASAALPQLRLHE